MDYFSTKDAAERWGVSQREVQRLLTAGRVPGAVKCGGRWLLPADIQKPADPRRERKNLHKAEATLNFLFSAVLPKDGADKALTAIDMPLRPLAAADLAFRRGDPEPAKAVWRTKVYDGDIKLSAASLATAAALSSGDYALYEELRHYLEVQTAMTRGETDRAILSLPGVLAAVSMSLPSMTPQWLKQCDFSLFPRELRPYLLYLHILHLRNTGEYSAMYAAAQTTLLLCERENTFTWLDVYLGVLCAVAAHHLCDTAQAMHYLEAALELGIPNGFLAPFADYLGDLGGLLETALAKKYPKALKRVTLLWESTFKSWMRFHNLYAADNITTALSPQEYQIAQLVAGGATYVDTAKRMYLSVSRVKNILSDVYSALCIQNKKELPAFVLIKK